VQTIPEMNMKSFLFLASLCPISLSHSLLNNIPFEAQTKLIIFMENFCFSFSNFISAFPHCITTDMEIIHVPFYIFLASVVVRYFGFIPTASAPHETYFMRLVWRVWEFEKERKKLWDYGNSVKNERKVFSNEITRRRWMNNINIARVNWVVSWWKHFVLVKSELLFSLRRIARGSIFSVSRAMKLARKFRGNSLCLRIARNLPLDIRTHAQGLLFSHGKL
jgi:hypothetical protein